MKRGNFEVFLMRQRKPLRDMPDELLAVRSAWAAEGICTYCGERVEPRLLVRDHIEPLSRGGEIARSNEAWACRRCNANKADMFPLEWVLVRAGLWARQRSRREDRLWHTSFRLRDADAA